MDAKQKGNIGETFVNNLFCKPFLEFFCYTSPIDETGDKKEICDLLVIFHETVIIVSVKNYDFKGYYDRYFNNTIEKAKNQIYGAERKLFGKQEIKIKHPKKEIETFPKDRVKKVYRIIVNLGDGLKFYPFSEKTKNDKFISIFDKDALEKILIELDTISDFTQYLDAREATFSNRIVTIMPKEEYDFDINDSTQFLNRKISEIEDLKKDNSKKEMTLSGHELDYLALYIENDRKFPKEFTSDEYTTFWGQFDGTWDDFISKKRVQAKKALDRHSYFVDEFVKREVLIFIEDWKIKLAIDLLSLNRFERRYFAKAFFTFIDRHLENPIPNDEILMARRHFEFKNSCFIFFLHSDKLDNENTMMLCRTVFLSFHVFSKYMYEKYVLIGVNQSLTQFKLAYNDSVEQFDSQFEEDIMHDAKLFGWYQNIQYLRGHEKEYPDIEEN